jgi:hypothetical protein
MNVIDYACLTESNAHGSSSAIVDFKALTLSAIEVLDVFPECEKTGLLGEIEDSWKRL